MSWSKAARAGARRYRQARRRASAKPSSSATATPTAISARASRRGRQHQRRDRDGPEESRAVAARAGHGNHRASTARRTRAGWAPTRCLACRWPRSRPTPSARASSLYAHVAHLAGNTAGYLLPVPMLNILNGGAHADSQRRLSGVHGDAGRRRLLQRRACGSASRSSTRCAESSRSAAFRPASATKAGSRRASDRIARRSKWCSKP